MAWLGNSPVLNTGQRRGSRAFSTGHLSIFLGKLHLQIPIFNTLYKWYQIRSLLHSINKQLYKLEKKIHRADFQKKGMAISLLREVMSVKKLSNHESLLSVKSKLYSRIEVLQRSLIQRSHQVVKNEESQESKSEVLHQNSHQRMLFLLDSGQDAAQRPSNQFTEKLYWRHSKNDYRNHFTHKTQNHSLMYVHASSQSLFQFLLGHHLTPGQDDIEYNFGGGFGVSGVSRFICGVSLKLKVPFVTKNSQEFNMSFWKRQSGIAPSILAHLNKKSLQDHINEVFFQSRTDYENFRELLQKHNECEILDLLTSLEHAGHIIIHENALTLHGS